MVFVIEIKDGSDYNGEGGKKFMAKKDMIDIREKSLADGKKDKKVISCIGYVGISLIVLSFINPDTIGVIGFVLLLLSATLGIPYLLKERKLKKELELLYLGN